MHGEVSGLLTPLGRDVDATRPKQAVDGRVRRAGAAAPAEPAAGDQPAPAGPAGHRSRRGRVRAPVRAGAPAGQRVANVVLNHCDGCAFLRRMRVCLCSILAVAEAVPDRARQLGRAALLPGAADALDIFFDGVFQHLRKRCGRGVVLTESLDCGASPTCVCGCSDLGAPPRRAAVPAQDGAAAGERRGGHGHDDLDAVAGARTECAVRAGLVRLPRRREVRYAAT